MRLQFDIVTSDAKELTYSFERDSIPEEALNVVCTEPDCLVDRVKSPKTFLIVMPDVVLKPHVLVGENAITVLPFPIDFTDKTELNGYRIAQLALSKAIACDYVTWEAIKSFVNARWIDMTGSVIPLKYDCNHLGSSFVSGNTIHFFGKAPSSFHSFLEGYTTEGKSVDYDIKGVVHADPYSLLHAPVAYGSNIAIVTKTRSRLFMDSLGKLFDLVMYPITGDNGHHVAGLDSRGATSILTGVGNIENMGIGKASNTVSTWKDFMFDMSNMLGSTKHFPYIRPMVDPFVVRLFNEINKSGF